MEAPKEARAQRVAAVVQKVARTNPSALRHVVASIAKADSSLAALAAGFAAKAQRESTGEIAAAACGVFRHFHAGDCRDVLHLLRTLTPHAGGRWFPHF